MNELLIVPKLTQYAALEVRPGETDAQVICAMLAAMEAAKRRCIGVETLGRHTIGSVTFVKFRTDVPQAPTVLPDRGSIIMQAAGSFVVKLPDGRQGKVPMPTMMTMVQQRSIFHGTVKDNWRMQFA